jgi:hypothetical protein
LDLGDDIKAAMNVFESLIDHAGKFFGLLTGMGFERLGLFELVPLWQLDR